MSFTCLLFTTSNKQWVIGVVMSTHLTREDCAGPAPRRTRFPPTPAWLLLGVGRAEGAVGPGAGVNRGLVDTLAGGDIIIFPPVEALLLVVLPVVLLLLVFDLVEVVVIAALLFPPEPNFVVVAQFSNSTGNSNSCSCSR